MFLTDRIKTFSNVNGTCPFAMLLQCDYIHPCTLCSQETLDPLQLGQASNLKKKNLVVYLGRSAKETTAMCKLTSVRYLIAT